MINNIDIYNIEKFIIKNNFQWPYSLIKNNNTSKILTIYWIYNSFYSQNFIKRDNVNIWDIYKYYTYYKKNNLFQTKNTLLNNIIKLIHIIENKNIKLNNNNDVNKLYNILINDIDIDNPNITTKEINLDINKLININSLDELIYLQIYLFNNLWNISYKLEMIQIIIYFIYFNKFKKDYPTLSISYWNILQKELFEVFLIRERYNNMLKSSIYMYYIYIIDNEIKLKVKYLLKQYNLSILFILSKYNNISSSKLYKLYKLKVRLISEAQFYNLLKKDKEMLWNYINMSKKWNNVYYSLNYENINELKEIEYNIKYIIEEYKKLLEDNINIYGNNIISKYE